MRFHTGYLCASNLNFRLTLLILFGKLARFRIKLTGGANIRNKTYSVLVTSFSGVDVIRCFCHGRVGARHNDIAEFTLGNSNRKVLAAGTYFINLNIVLLLDADT